MQLRLLCKTVFPTFPDAPQECSAYTRLFLTDTPSRLVYVLYAKPQTDAPIITHTARAKWEGSLGLSNDDKDWQYCLDQLQAISPNGRLRLIHFKYIHQYYYTSLRLYRYKLQQSAVCDRCWADPADFLHLAWCCPVVANFWGPVFATLSTMLWAAVHPTPLVALLHCTRQIPRAVRRLASVALFLAKRCVAVT